MKKRRRTGARVVHRKHLVWGARWADREVFWWMERAPFGRWQAYDEEALPGMRTVRE